MAVQMIMSTNSDLRREANVGRGDKRVDQKLKIQKNNKSLYKWLLGFSANLQNKNDLEI